MAISFQLGLTGHAGSAFPRETRSALEECRDPSRRFGGWSCG